MSSPRLVTSFVPTHRAPTTLSRVLAGALFILSVAVLVEVLFEGWLQIRFGARTVTSNGTSTGAVVVDPLAWPKLVKNGLYFGLAALTAAKITVDRRWREFRTGADIALAVLIVAMILAGLVGGSATVLIGQALFVYFRGVVLFYAWRAMRPTWRQIRLALLIVGGVVALNAVIALVELVLGVPAYVALGWTDLKWANTNRAHALLTHPNHLGHLLALTILGLTCWFVSRSQVSRRAWLTLGVLVVALSASQSREAVIAVTTACALIWVLTRSHLRRILLVVALIAVSSVGIVAARPSNWVEWQRRLTGVVDAFRVPSGTEGNVRPGPATPSPSPTSGATQAPHVPSPVPAREIRVLYYQQGLRLWTHEPILGYGVGQFGGIVAQENNPNWHLNPRFGPEGFNRHGFKSVQIDSFWLHLLVETGTVGFVAYLAWLFMLIYPLLQRIRQYRAPRPPDPDDPDAPDPDVPAAAPSAPDPAKPFVLWAVVAVAFVAQVAFLSATLEDPLLPALLFTIIGLAWAVKSGHMPPQGPSTRTVANGIESTR